MAICLSDGALPLSKSIAQRLLIINWLAARDGRGHFSSLTGNLGSDNHYLQSALMALLAGRRQLDCGEGGTTWRFLCALSLVVPGRLELTGSQRLGERPVAPLLAVLQQLGVVCQWRHCGDGWFLILENQGLKRPAASLVVDCSQSSQFLSALLLVAPCLPDGLSLRVAGPLVSRPYAQMTVRIMQKFGATVSWNSDDTIIVSPGGYKPTDYQLPADWSAAAFVLAAGWLTGREVTLPGCTRDGLQPDEVFGQMAAAVLADSAELDLTACPDLLPALTICAIFSNNIIKLNGIAHTEVKESPRASLLVQELAKVGANLAFDGRTLTIKPAPLHGGARLEPHGDHRLAMAFGLLTLRLPDIVVAEPECVVKSFPNFWSVLELCK